MYHVSVSDMRLIEWARNWNWAVRFPDKETPEEFQKWFPATDLNYTYAGLESMNLTGSHQDFTIPLRSMEKRAHITLVDGAKRTMGGPQNLNVFKLHQWAKTWFEQIVHYSTSHVQDKIYEYTWQNWDEDGSLELPFFGKTKNPMFQGTYHNAGFKRNENPTTFTRRISIWGTQTLSEACKRMDIIHYNSLSELIEMNSYAVFPDGELQFSGESDGSSATTLEIDFIIAGVIISKPLTDEAYNKPTPKVGTSEFEQGPQAGSNPGFHWEELPWGGGHWVPD